MSDPICHICGQPITEQQFDAEDYLDTSYGEWHLHCIDEYEQDRDGRAADHYHDTSIDS